jgi:hypothetical protein
MDDQRNSFAPFEHAKSHRKLVSIRLHFKSALERNNGKPWSVNDPFQRAMFLPKLHWYGLVPIASWCLVIGTEMKLGLSKLQVSRQSKTRQTKHKTRHQQRKHGRRDTSRDTSRDTYRDTSGSASFLSSLTTFLAPSGRCISARNRWSSLNLRGDAELENNNNIF